MAYPTYTSPYNETYIKYNIHATDIKVEFIGKITGIIDKYNFNENSNPEYGKKNSRFNDIFNTGYFYLNKKIFEEYNLLYGLKLPLPQFFLDKKLLAAVILDIPEIRRRLLYKSSQTSKINEEERTELDLFNLVVKGGVTDKTADDDNNDGTIDVSDNISLEEGRDKIFNSNLKVIYDIFFIPGNLFFADGFKFIIASDPSSNLLINRIDLPSNLHGINKRDLINSYIIRTLIPFKIDSNDGNDASQKVYDYEFKAQLEHIGNNNKAITKDQRVAAAKQYAESEQNKFKDEFEALSTRIKLRPREFADSLAEYANILIEKLRKRARKEKINVDFKYINGGIQLITRGRTYYKNILLTIVIYPYNERFSFPFKSYCSTTRNKLIGNKGVITKKLQYDFDKSRIGEDKSKEIFTKLGLSTIKSDIQKGKINYKQYIRKERLKEKKGGGNRKIKKIRKTTKLGKIYKRKSKRRRRKFKY